MNPENESLAERLLAAENRLLRESLDSLSGYVDPRAALLGPDGRMWSAIGDTSDARSNAAFATEQQLAEARQTGRLLERTNEFAINGHENRVSYIVGSGHTYQAVARKGRAASDLVPAAQAVLDEFLRVNRWQQRQQEIVRRRDRDGEVFLRLFPGQDGILRVRFVEPNQVYRPTELAHVPAASFGIETDRDDVETVLRYWIDGEPVAAEEIQHRKIGVDRNVKRGIPLFYPVRHNLRRAERLLENMATVADIQTAIALIRRHDRATRSATETFRLATAPLTGPGVGTPDEPGTTAYYTHYAPGTILDVPKTVEYTFPAAGLDASRYVKVLQAILRSIASRLVFPEFMLTSDASNANYSSTLVAEGPAVKMFQRWQADLVIDDLEVLWQALHAATGAGRLPRGVEREVEIQVGLPRVSTRDEKQQAEVNEIYHRLGIKSPQTIAAELGLDHQQEQKNFGQ